MQIKIYKYRDDNAYTWAFDFQNRETAQNYFTYLAEEANKDSLSSEMILSNIETFKFFWRNKLDPNLVFLSINHNKTLDFSKRPNLFELFCNQTWLFELQGEDVIVVDDEKKTLNFELENFPYTSDNFLLSEVCLPAPAIIFSNIEKHLHNQILEKNCDFINVFLVYDYMIDVNAHGGLPAVCNENIPQVNAALNDFNRMLLIHNQHLYHDSDFKPFIQYAKLLHEFCRNNPDMIYIPENFERIFSQLALKYKTILLEKKVNEQIEQQSQNCFQKTVNEISAKVNSNSSVKTESKLKQEFNNYLSQNIQVQPRHYEGDLFKKKTSLNLLKPSKSGLSNVFYPMPSPQ